MGKNNMNGFKFGIVITLFSIVSLKAAAGLELPNYYSDRMVLQRNHAIPIRGRAVPGQTVEITFNKLSRQTKVAEDGTWQIDFPSLPAGGPYNMVIKSGKDKKLIRDIMIGEVWLCSGQSNMVFPVRRTINLKEAQADCDYSDLRVFNVWKNWQLEPVHELKKGLWLPSNPKRVGNFSAVAWFFGRELRKKLGVPIGLITSAWSGSQIDTWMSMQTLKSNPVFAAIVKKAEKNIRNNMKGIKKPYFQPTVLFNGMINPLPPYPIRGVIWYQGEANRGDGMLYADKMAAMLKNWRQLWNNPDLPFYFVQIAPFKYTWGKPETLPEIWAAQNEFVKRVPYTGMAVINDLGNLKDIHPKNKAPVGRRLAALALNKTYGMKGIVCDFPTFADMQAKKSQLIVKFDHALGLKTRDGKAPDWFEICGSDKKYYPATAKISRNKIILTSSKVAKPVGVRFAWYMTATPNLINAAGLPAGPFRVEL